MGDPPKYKPAVPPTYPGKVGFGRLAIPPAKNAQSGALPKKPVLPKPGKPAELGNPAPVSAPAHELTRTDGVLQPAPGSAPEPPVERTLKDFPPAPRRSLSPPPESVAARVRVGDVDVKVGKTFASKLKGWIVPVMVTAATSAGGYLKGYAEGMLAATRRVDALEATIAAERRAREKSEAAHSVYAKVTDEWLDSVVKVQRDHDARLIKAEKQLKEAVPTIQGLPPK